MRWIPATLVLALALAVAATAIAATFNGSSRGERLVGTSAADVIRGKAGNDTLLGRGGDDRLLAGPGNDKASAGPGRDRLFGGPGRDRLVGGPGNDLVVGGPGVDVLVGGPGNDRLNTRDTSVETARCGAGSRDVATVDAGDRTSGCETVRRPGGVDPTLGDPPPPTPLERGLVVFNRSCSSCHGVGAVGGGAPRLVGRGLAEERIRGRIVNGGESMPAGLVSGQALEDVIDYLQALQ